MTSRTGTVFGLIDELILANTGAVFLVVAQTDEEFEEAFDKWLDRAVRDLEASKKSFTSLGEDGLSSALAMGLSSFPFISATRETNSNGHVDLTIEIGFGPKLRRKLGEAKIYGGPAYHVKGLQQLLDRYTTGRETRGLVIEYVKDSNVAELMKKIRDTMDEQLPCKQKGTAKDHVMKWSFISLHGHSSGEDMEVGHIGCNLYVDDGQEKS